VSIETTPRRSTLQTKVRPARRHEQSEDLRRLQACLQALDAERREIVLLAYYTGLSRDEIATRFGHPVNTIKTWLHRSLAQLRKCLGS
jgi:RNA polymerase sigma-70 factor (ECF subfamily)